MMIKKYDSQALTYGYEVQLFDTLIEQNSLEYNNLIAAKQGLNEINNHNNNVSGIKGYKNNLDICDNDQSYIQQHNQGSNNTGNITVKQSMLSSVTPNKLKKTSQQFPFLNSPITDPKHSHQRNNSDYKSNSLTKPGYYILHEYPELKIFKDEVKIADCLIDIGKASANDLSLILKGGNELMDISQKNAGVFYDANKDVILNKTTLQKREVY
eukprot:403376799